jgi:hypothetical protein
MHDAKLTNTDLKRTLQALSKELQLLKYMLGMVLSGIVALIMKAFL